MVFQLILIILVTALLSLLYAYCHYHYLTQIQAPRSLGMIEDQQKDIQSFSVAEIGSIISEGASQFIQSQYKVCSIFIFIMAGIIFVCVDKWSTFYTTFAFIVGAFTSMLCGAFGMKVATFSNFRTTTAAKHSLELAFRTAFKAGCVIGFTLVSLSVLMLLCLLLLYKFLLSLDDSSENRNYYEYLFEVIAGYGLGGSTVALFARVGGGIFTKAADLGSDLVGKIEAGLPEDSPKNPATIADNVGDNVGDIAGMGADLFGSFAQSTCAALVIGGNSIISDKGNVQFQNLLFILMIPTIGLLVCILTSWILTSSPQIKESDGVKSALIKELIYSTVLLIPCLWVATYTVFTPFKYVHHDGSVEDKNYSDIFFCIIFGLIAGLIVGYFTEIMTSHSHKPVNELSDACRTGPATNIIYGLALGYLSTIVPVLVIAAVCYFSHSNLGYFGVALSSLGMLANLPICLAIDSYGPISDNAGGIAEMSGLPENVRERTDILDAAGNTTAAIGKGFAIGSATLVGFALYGGFLHTSYTIGSIKKEEMSFDDPMIFTFLLIGAMLPYAFSALTMKSVGKAALGMIEEVRRQIRGNPQILQGTAPPNYRQCVRISTNSSLKEMIAPGLLVTATPFFIGVLFGPKALLGFLPGAIVSGVQMAISASNSGGAWDNAKKYIQAGLMKDENGNIIRKGSMEHQAAVIGDTVGDPLKDTSGPSLNILIKLMAILSLVFCHYFSNPLLSVSKPKSA